MGFKLDKYKDDKDFQTFLATITKPLEKSKKGLQADIARLKKQLEGFKGVDPAKHKKYKKKLKEMEEQAKTNESDAEKQLRLARKQHKKEMKNIRKEVKLLSNSNKKLLVDGQITKTLVKAKVKDALMDAARALIKPKVTLEVKDGERVAMIGDKTIKKYIKDWAKSEEGKHFVLAPHNSGGDSSGSGQQKSKSDWEKIFDKKSDLYSVTKQLELKKSNEDLYKSLLKKYNPSMYEKLYAS